MAKSIREYVSEPELVLELFKLKLSNALKDIDTKTPEQIIELFEKNKTRRLSSIARDLIKFQDEPKVVESLNANAEYINSLKPFINKSDVHALWAEKVKDFREAMEELGQKVLEENIVLSEKVSKEKFGEMLMLIVNNLGTKPCFGTYTRNWKDDFYSNAVEDTLESLNNFDNKMLSKRTGKPMKAFAYITQIAFNAFLAVIKQRKNEQKLQKSMLPYEVSLVEGNVDMSESKILHDENDYFYEEFTLELPSFHIETEKDDMDEDSWDDEVSEELVVLEDETQEELPEEVEYIKDFIEFASNYKNNILNVLEKIDESNRNHDYNKGIKKEIEYLQRITPEDQKNKDFEDYISELKPKRTLYKETKFVKIKTTEPFVVDKSYSFQIIMSKV